MVTAGACVRSYVGDEGKMVALAQAQVEKSMAQRTAAKGLLYVPSFAVCECERVQETRNITLSQNY